MHGHERQFDQTMGKWNVKDSGQAKHQNRVFAINTELSGLWAQWMHCQIIIILERVHSAANIILVVVLVSESKRAVLVGIAFGRDRGLTIYSRQNNTHIFPGVDGKCGMVEGEFVEYCCLPLRCTAECECPGKFDSQIRWWCPNYMWK